MFVRAKENPFRKSEWGQGTTQNQRTIDDGFVIQWVIEHCVGLLALETLPRQARRAHSIEVTEVGLVGFICTLRSLSHLSFAGRFGCLLFGWLGRR